MMRCSAGLDAHQTGREFLEEGQNVSAFQLPADDHATVRIHAMNLEN
jgi:hypothetical protein